MSKSISFYPKEIRDIIHEKVLPYSRIIKIADKLKTKKLIKFICQECQKESTLRFDKLNGRKYAKLEPVCSECIMKYTTNNILWKETNSNAQLIAQNRSEVIEKQRKAQQRLIKEDKDYVLKRRSKNFLSGKIQDIYFDSSWELFYIIYCLENPDILSIQRCKDKIRFYDTKNISRNYFPDFIIRYKNLIEKVIEIKGNLSKNSQNKIKAAKKYYGDKFEIIRYSDLKKMGIFVKSEVYLKYKFDDIIRKYIIYFNNNTTLQSMINRGLLDENKINIKT